MGQGPGHAACNPCLPETQPSLALAQKQGPGAPSFPHLPGSADLPPWLLLTLSPPCPGGAQSWEMLE